MNKINFSFGIHNHQPVGNLDDVFQIAYKNCYLPFIRLLEKHPKVRVSLHYTGPLLEFFQSNHPDFFDTLRTLLQRNQIELMGGGFYEPILPAIPERDALGQIKMMQDYIKDKFGVTPQGIWLAERVWEPQLVSLIAKAGLKYVALDDTHFYYAGLKHKDIFGYYITEDQGYSIGVFPIDKGLRYKIPFKLAHESIDYFKKVSDQYPNTGITLADDGEKFGLWPGTHKWVYKDGYLEKLFTLLEENSSWINMNTFSEYISSYPAKGKIYLPTASYDEMMEWALPSENQTVFETIVNGFRKTSEYDILRPYLRGGFWRNFLIKYRESNQMYSKMLHISKQIEKKENSRTTKARKELYKAQCNCAYWHGLFGGIYLNYLRHSVYYHLIGAEKLVNTVKDIIIEEKDYDFDGKKEILVSTPKLNVYISPHCGGQITELDYKPKQFNLSNVFTRIPEAYHKKIVVNTADQKTDANPKSIHDITNTKEDGLKNMLFYDWYKRNSLIDHILDDTVKLKDFKRCRYKEIGDFVNQPYKAEKYSRSKVNLSKQGRAGEDSFNIKKSFQLGGSDTVVINYKLTNSGDKALRIWFGIEFNFTLLAGSEPQRYFELPDKKNIKEPMDITSELEETKGLNLTDQYSGFKLIMNWSQPAILWRFPIETVSNSESGIERTYQGSCIMPSWKFTFRPKETISLDVKLTLNKI